MTELRVKILSLHEEGKSYNEISSLLGCAKSTISYHVGEGQKDKTRLRTRNSRGKKRRYVSDIKAATPCTDCKINYPAHIMDFDHVRGEKKHNICDMINNCSWEELEEELKKCELVCANCHRQRTWYRQIKTGAQAHDYTRLV